MIRRTMAIDQSKTWRRDSLLEIESKVRSWWDESDVFKAEAREKPPEPGEKFFGNFPFPYMNGFLHVGHAFTISKLEFAAAFHRLRGANVLLPFAFHCTGMPIKASADKLRQEIQQFGNPPVFPKDVEERVEKKAEADNANSGAPAGKFKSKKSKAVAKSGGQKYQWEIMQSFGLSDDEIAKFQDPYEWLRFFPPLAVEDLKAFGLGCDWRRSFATTDMNPYFDSFVQWQMRKLKAMGKVVKDVKYTIFSPLDRQPCGDHDRANGEGVKPEEYTLIKMKVLPPFPPKLETLKGKNVFLVTAMSRPEAITNAWVLPDGKYGAFEITETDVFIMTERAALNLAYQNFSKVPQQVSCSVELTGRDLIHLPLQSSLASDDVIYALPKLTVPTDKGTGIVTSACSDVPDEYVASHDLKGSKLIDTGEAIVYREPEKRVVSRSGDECVVALTDQWYIIYGEEEWKKIAEECMSCMNLYSDETRHGFEQSLRRLNQWACSRSFGLGTRIPWDPEFLVESLSDSTIYMAYYTVAHLLHNGDMYGTKNSHPVQPKQMTDEVWDFIICGGAYPKSSDIPSSILDKMRKEFEYWYPFDLRVSGKDLIQHHLTFCIYNHAAIMEKRHWPGGFRCNGFLMVNSEKMSKSTGNFRTLRQAIEEFSADATRFSLADGGDGIDDANFAFQTTKAAIIYLTNEIAWMEKILAAQSSLRMGPASTFHDGAFDNQINICIQMTEQNYQDYMFREALKTGFYDLQAARDWYILSCGSGGMNRDLVWRFMDVQTRLIAPICPHYSEYVWRELLKMDGFVVNAGWPLVTSPNLTLQAADKYLQESIALMRKLLEKQFLGSKKGNKKEATDTAPSEMKITGLIYVNEQFDGWKAECLKILQSKFNSSTRTFAADAEIMEALKESSVGQATNFKQLCMPFVRYKKDAAISTGPQALDLKLPFGEIEVLEENLDLIKRLVRIDEKEHKISLDKVEILSATDPDAIAKAGSLASLLNHSPPTPGSPTAIFVTK